MEKRIRFTIILVLILIVVIAFSFQSKEKKEYLVYNEALDKTAVTVDDVSLTLKDIAFYVAYEEKTVQEQAILYNPDNPRQYWNVYTDGQFVKLTAKQAARSFHGLLYDLLPVSVHPVIRSIDLPAHEADHREERKCNFHDKNPGL